jgi:thiol-disulfide isomerase/thioredoxin
VIYFSRGRDRPGRASREEETMIFNTVDIDGNRFTDREFGKYKVTMMNFWEPWCGPCKRELGDLEKLYENYKDKGFCIFGVYSDFTMDDEVRRLMEENGISYPMLRRSNDFDYLLTGYVPTTVFVGSQGNSLSFKPLIGSRSYEGWEAIIKQYLG